MSLLARIKNRAAGQPVIADDDDNEFDNIINVISGQNVGKSIRVVNSDNAFACARFDQTGANNIIEGYANGAEVFKFEKDGDLITTARVVGPNAHPTEDNQLARRLYVDDQKVRWTQAWTYVVLPGAVESVESQGRWIVPDVDDCFIEDITSVWAAGADSSASNIFTIKKRNAAGTVGTDVGTIDINSGAKDVVNVSNPSDYQVIAGDQIYPLFTTRNVASEQMVTIEIRGYQKPKL